MITSTAMLGECIDQYEQTLARYPNIQPKQSCTVLQQIIGMSTLDLSEGTIGYLAPPEDDKDLVVTLHREAVIGEDKTLTATGYRFILLAPESAGLRRRTGSHFSMAGQCTETSGFNSQGTQYSLNDPRMEQIHTSLAALMLASPESLQHIERIQVRYDEIVERLADPKISTSDKKQAELALKHARLK